MALTEITLTPNASIAAIASESWRPNNARKLEDHLLRVYDLAGRNLMIEFPVLWDWGGRRIALSNCGEFVFVGSYYVHGLACYSTKSGDELWRRRDLKGVQEVAVSPDGAQVFCGREPNKSALLDSMSGTNSVEVRGLRSLLFSAVDDTALLDVGKQRKLEIHKPIGKRHGALARESFAILDAAFSKRVVAIREAGRPLRGIDLENFHEVWHHAEEKDSECRSVAYHETERVFVACMLTHGNFVLTNVAIENGERVNHPTELSHAGEFFLRGSRFLAWDGVIYDVLTGTELGRIDLCV